MLSACLSVRPEREDHHFFSRNDKNVIKTRVEVFPLSFVSFPRRCQPIFPLLFFPSTDRAKIASKTMSTCSLMIVQDAGFFHHYYYCYYHHRRSHRKHRGHELVSPPLATSTPRIDKETLNSPLLHYLFSRLNSCRIFIQTLLDPCTTRYARTFMGCRRQSDQL